MIKKVCPFIVRQNDSRQEILVFRHPIGKDIQLVKGTLEKNEDLKTAALRELFEESGIEKLSHIEFVETKEIPSVNQIWHFFRCYPSFDLPENWTFFANDNGGLDFSFFWFDLAEKPSDEWHPIFQEALSFIKSRL